MQNTEATTVLVVDDEPAVRTVITLMLQRRGYRAMAAGSAFEALALLDELHRCGDHVSLILLDLGMPTVPGQDFRQLQLGTPALAQIPTVVVTGRILDAEELDALQPAETLLKPFTHQHPCDLVHRLTHAPVLQR